MKSPEPEKSIDELRKDASIEDLREELARQILLLALKDPNAQMKLDSYKATARPPVKPAAEIPANDAMSMFQARVRKAAEATRDGSDE